MARLPKTARLRTLREFQRVYREGTARGDRFIKVIGTANDLGVTRLGIAAGRRLGSAVVRNRMRRVIREAFRAVASDLPAGLDLVVVPRGDAAGLTVAGTIRSLLHLARKIALHVRRPDGDRAGEAASGEEPCAGS